jgi:tRNA dimethylallyltransferase
VAERDASALTLNTEHLPYLARCFFIAGPTAVGKTDVAVAVAEACNGEIVNADAFQVYRGLDIVTAKPSPQSMSRVAHHLVGTVELAESYNVARYLESARGAITSILRRGRLPIIVGGTGLYLRALTRGLSDAPPSSPQLRAELQTTPLPELLVRLEALDPIAAATVDRENPRRVVRALEVVILTGKPFSSFRQEWKEAPPFHGVLLERDRAEQHDRINRRTAAMFEQGVVEEVRAAQRLPMSETARQVIGLRPIEELIAGKLTQAECIAAICQSTRQYAKRQLTWFRREPMLRAVSLTAATEIQALQEIVSSAAAVVQLEPL